MIGVLQPKPYWLLFVMWLPITASSLETSPSTPSPEIALKSALPKAARQLIELAWQYSPDGIQARETYTLRQSHVASSLSQYEPTAQMTLGGSYYSNPVANGHEHTTTGQLLPTFQWQSPVGSRLRLYGQSAAHQTPGWTAPLNWGWQLQQPLSSHGWQYYQLSRNRQSYEFAEANRQYHNTFARLALSVISQHQRLQTMARQLDDAQARVARRTNQLKRLEKENAQGLVSDYDVESVRWGLRRETLRLSEQRLAQQAALKKLAALIGVPVVQVIKEANDLQPMAQPLLVKLPHPNQHPLHQTFRYTQSKLALEKQQMSARQGPQWHLNWSGQRHHSLSNRAGEPGVSQLLSLNVEIPLVTNHATKTAIADIHQTEKLNQHQWSQLESSLFDKQSVFSASLSQCVCKADFELAYLTFLEKSIQKEQRLFNAGNLSVSEWQSNLETLEEKRMTIRGNHYECYLNYLEYLAEYEQLLGHLAERYQLSPPTWNG